MKTRNFTQLHVGQHSVAKSLLSLLLVTLMAWLPSTMFAENTAKGLVCANRTLYLVYDDVEYAAGSSTYDESTVKNVYEIPVNAKMSSWNGLNSVTKISIQPSFVDFRPQTCESWFEELHYVTAIEGLNNLNTSEVKTMKRMFYECWYLTSIDLSTFNTGNVTDMSEMFYDCWYLKSLDLSTFNTGNVTSMESMFDGCDRLKSLDISSFGNSKVKNARYMFHDTSGDEITIPSGFLCGDDIDASYMFYDSKIRKVIFEEGSLVGKVNMDNMFEETGGEVIFPDNFGKGASMKNMFCDAMDKRVQFGKNFGEEADMTNALNGDIYTDQYDGLIFPENFGKNANMSNLFTEGREGKTIHYNMIFKTGFGNGANMSRMFEDFTFNKNELDYIEFEDNFAEDADMSYMFYNAHIEDDSYDYTMRIIFGDNCGAKNLSHLFDGFYHTNYRLDRDLNRTYIQLGENFGYNATDMSHMFHVKDDKNTRDMSLIEIEGLDNIRTPKVTNMSYMFAGLNGKSVRNLDLSNFDMSKVTNIHGMFKNMSIPHEHQQETGLMYRIEEWNGDPPSEWEPRASSVKWDELAAPDGMGLQTITWPKGLTNGEYTTAHITDMGELFYGCEFLRHLTFGPWFTTSGLTTKESAQNMFYECESLTYVDFFDCPDTELFPNNDNVKFWYDYKYGGASYFDDQHEHCYPFWGMSDQTLVYLPKVQTQRAWTSDFLESVNYHAGVSDNERYQHKISNYLYSLSTNASSYLIRRNLIYTKDDGTQNCDWFYHTDNSYNVKKLYRSMYDSEIPRGFIVRQQIDYDRTRGENANRFGTAILPFEWSVPDKSQKYLGDGLNNFQPFILESELDGTMFFKGVGSVPANTPFLFKWRQPSDDIDSKDGTGTTPYYTFERTTDPSQGIPVEATTAENMKREGGCTATNWDTQGFYEAQTLRYDSGGDYFYVPYKGSDEAYVKKYFDGNPEFKTFEENLYVADFSEDIYVDVTTSSLQVRIPRKNIFYISGGKFYRASKKDMIIDPYRVIFIGAWDKNEEAYYSKPYFSVFDDDIDDDSMTTAIERFEQDCEIDDASAIYDTQGHRLQELQKGINIVRMKNGTVKKIIRR